MRHVNLVYAISIYVNLIFFPWWCEGCWENSAIMRRLSDEPLIPIKLERFVHMDLLDCFRNFTFITIIAELEQIRAFELSKSKILILGCEWLLGWAYPSLMFSENFSKKNLATILFSRTSPFLEASRNLFTSSKCFIWVPHVPKYVWDFFLEFWNDSEYLPWFKRYYLDFSISFWIGKWLS